MHGPEIESEGVFSAGNVLADFLHSPGDFGRHLAGEMHVKSNLANFPGNEVAGFGDAQRKKAVNAEASRFGADEACSASVGEEKEGEHPLEVLGFLQM